MCCEVSLGYVSRLHVVSGCRKLLRFHAYRDYRPARDLLFVDRGAGLSFHALAVKLDFAPQHNRLSAFFQLDEQRRVAIGSIPRNLFSINHAAGFAVNNFDHFANTAAVIGIPGNFGAIRDIGIHLNSPLLVFPRTPLQ
jgi:hypothetical protein